MNAEQNSNQDRAVESADSVPPIDVAASPRLQEILQASSKSCRKHGVIPAEEVRRLIRECEAEEPAATEAGN